MKTIMDLITEYIDNIGNAIRFLQVIYMIMY